MALISVPKPMVASALLALVLWVPAPASASPSVTLSPSHGQPGDIFVISGRGFDAGEMVRITWDGSQLGGLVPADGVGAFTATRTVPQAAQPGGYMVETADRPPQHTLGFGDLHGDGVDNDDIHHDIHHDVYHDNHHGDVDDDHRDHR